MRIGVVIRTMLLVVATTSVASAQVGTWAEKRLQELARVNLAAEQMDRDKDVETPSLAKATSLVDQTDAPDLISLGMSLYDAANLDSGKAPVTVTLSGWALKTAVSQQNPLDPAVYSRGANWRRWSVTVGRELDAGTPAAARVLGTKLLLWNQRDVSSRAHRADIAAVNTALMAAAKEFAASAGRINNFLFGALRTRVTPPLAGDSEPALKLDFINAHLNSETFDTTLALLTDDEKALLDDIVREMIPIDKALTELIAQVVARIRGAPQLAVMYQARLRPGDGTDEHRWEAAFDYGPTDALKLAVNGSLDLKQVHEADHERGARVSFELAWAARGETAAQRALEILRPRPKQAKSPITLSVAGELEWRPDKSSVRTVQGKLTIPIPALKGIALPISVTWANDPELIDEHDVRGQVGFTLDFSQLKRGFTALGR
jgi:hypothetical protein